MSARQAIVPVYLALCLVLGGASAAGNIANMILQLAAIALLWGAFMVKRKPFVEPAERQLVYLFALLVAVFAIQLIPMPPALWTLLPGRKAVAEGFTLLGLPLPWLSISLAPARTLASMLWLLPATAVLFGILRLGAFRTAWLGWSIIGVTVMSVLLGALQFGGKEGSPWYLYSITNYGFAVGFFSNNNHMATLLLSAIPLLAALLAVSLTGRRRSKTLPATIIVVAVIFAIFVVGLGINTSLAGIGLAGPVICASLLIVARERWRRLGKLAIVGMLLVSIAGIALVFSAPFDNNLTTNAARGSEGSRYTSFTRTLAASSEYFPVGSGIGTFLDVYREHEDPATVTRTYMNHAHSDLIEIWLETGVFGAALILLFLLWWARRAIQIWRTPGGNPFDQAAVVATGAILAHSLVDYPLRTAAISALFAACVALMAHPRTRAAPPRAASARHLSAD